MSETLTISKILSGERIALSKAITLVESTREEDREKAENLLNELMAHAGNSIRIGISGIPGVGKSTFIEAFGMALINKGHKVAVLAVDPSSSQGKGSILGDKTRMPNLSAQKNAFIRPSPSSGNLGGVAARTRESIVLCEAAGFDVIVVETVGVGQSETAVSGMVDFFLLLMIAGAGDELQGIKRGIMEIADLIVVNKADGENIAAAKAARQAYARALHLFSQKESGWTPQVLTCSALEQKGIDDILKQIEKFKNLVHSNGYFLKNRKNQEIEWFQTLYRELVTEILLKNKEIQNTYQMCINGIINHSLTPGSAVSQMKQLLSKVLF